MQPLNYRSSNFRLFSNLNPETLRHEPGTVWGAAALGELSGLLAQQSLLCTFVTDCAARPAALHAWCSQCWYHAPP